MIYQTENGGSSTVGGQRRATLNLYYFSLWYASII
ncbi:hypothetical protein CGRA01v4_11300 [Colletotrichum graminicola]|nr:hypothetical protein CGRA01v4_11300 [Colletotrichum graminicola]